MIFFNDFYLETGQLILDHALFLILGVYFCFAEITF